MPLFPVPEDVLEADTVLFCGKAGCRAGISTGMMLAGSRTVRSMHEPAENVAIILPGIRFKRLLRAFLVK